MNTKTDVRSGTRECIVEGLQALGCKVEAFTNEAGIQFDYGGGHYVALPSEDLDYLCVYFPSFSLASDFPSLFHANLTINELNSRVRLARVWLDSGELHASAETILIPGIGVTDVLARLLRTLQYIVLETRIRQRALVSGPVSEKPMDSLDQNLPPAVALH